MHPQRPFLVTLLALIAGLAAALSLVITLQMLGLLSPWLGAVAFFGNGSLGAAAWAGLALLALWLVWLLLRVEARGWLLLVKVSSSLLVMGMLSIVGGSDAAAMLPPILLGGVGLLLLALPGAREAFRGMTWSEPD